MPGQVSANWEDTLASALDSVERCLDRGDREGASAGLGTLASVAIAFRCDQVAARAQRLKYALDSGRLGNRELAYQLGELLFEIRCYAALRQP
ncbi:hypothetical protein SAMN02800692_1495 [Luteibacter sp. UNC138MFCol5.1]|uniref:hypothetical protein n=1 Tax=Luteibacter sp. UNC138MFCol5.1 TaxID=1502774 RepID=UPI0008CCBA3A|nr:hypothetical protein [Luteibacter sp. UNC138MFCol5.1]SEO63047.1 hypothetical protein SAMN02800692_1495 [Luteibacter sp. UNC138MFCol5.1]